MAYSLRYYKEITHEDGKVIRLEIHKKDSTAAAIEIGAVIQGLSLQIQGSQGDVDAPIIKTSLNMTFVDAYDLENGKKNGFWEEFYTPDALMWKVIVKAKNATENAFTTIWGGYVTPDSFSENLTYRGSVSITARDNIGHMQDFPFDAAGDANGLISLKTLVDTAWSKIESPMSLVWQSAQMMKAEGVTAHETMMNVSAFEGMNWYEAVEKALYSYGLVMRFGGENKVNIGALRYLPNLGYASVDSVPHVLPVFVTGATRELIPAVKRIEESASYDIEDAVFKPVKEANFTGTTENFTIIGNSVDKTGIAHPILNKTSGAGWCNPEYSLFFNPNLYEFGTSDSDAQYMWLSANNGYYYDSGKGVRYAEYSRYINAERLVLNLSFGSSYYFAINGKLYSDSDALKTCLCVIKLVQNGITYYLQPDGTWGTGVIGIEIAIEGGKVEFPIDASGYTGVALMVVQIHQIVTEASARSSARYVPLYSASFGHGKSLLEANHVNTNYDSRNNVTLTRDVEFAPAYDLVAVPEIIKNGIFIKSGDNILPAKAWGWSGSTPQQMAVYNHLQLLAYYAKPNNFISGTIVNADITKIAAIYTWKGAEHILVSGNYNLLTGHIDGAMLREFQRYETLWSGEIGGAGMPTAEENRTSNVEGGSSSSSASTYNNTTTIVVGGGDGGFWELSNDVLSTDFYTRINNSLIVQGDIASGGQGGATSVGVSGIKVNGNIYRDSDDGILDGIIDLGTIQSGGGGITNITSQMVIDALQYTPAKSTDLANYLPLDGGKTMTGWIRTSYKGSFLEDESGNGIIGVNLPSGAWGGVDSGDAFGTVVRQTTIRSSGDNLYHYNNTSAKAYKIIDEGNIGSQTAGYAKELTTGTYRYMTFSATDKYVAFGDAAAISGLYATYIDGSNIYLRVNKGTSVAMSVASNANVTFEKNIIVKGDVASGGGASSTTAYLPLTGGIISNPSTSQPLTINNPSAGGGWIKFTNQSSNLGYLGFNSEKVAHCTDASGVERQIIHKGNIGSSTAGSAYALVSSAGATIVSHNAANNYVNIRGVAIGYGGNTIEMTTSAKLYIQKNVTQATILNMYGGNVGIGTENPATKLDVNGSGKFADTLTISNSSVGMIVYRSSGAPYIRFGQSSSKEYGEVGVNDNGNLVFWSLVSSNPAYGAWNPILNSKNYSSIINGSDIRFKNKWHDFELNLDSMAKAPLFVYTWNDGRDTDVHLGSSAQYWEGVASWVVDGTDFKALNYPVLGVAMGISLARKTRDLEARVMELEAEVERLRQA